jgi:uncharacterized protein (TIGR02594 family)
MPQLVEIRGLSKADADQRAAEISIDATQVDTVQEADGTFTVRAMLPDGMEVPGAVPVDGGADAGTAANQTSQPTGSSSAAGDEPQWYGLAKKEIGNREDGNSNDGPVIRRYIQLAHCGKPGEPWCAIFANAMFALCTPPVQGTKSPSSQSFRTNSNFVRIDGPALGAVTVFWRDSPNSGLGHVGFYNGETSDFIFVLGGNEDNMVEVEPVPRNQLIGFWWPAAVSPPTIAKVVLPPGTRKTRTQLT